MPHSSDPECTLHRTSHVPAVSLTASIDAVMLIIRLSARYGPLMFRHDAMAESVQPLCRPVGSIALSESDVKLGEIAGCEYWIDASAIARLGQGAYLLDVLNPSVTPHGTPALTDRFVLRPQAG